MLSLDCSRLAALLCLTTYFFLLIYSLFPSSLSLYPSRVLAISIHRDTLVSVDGGVTKASGCSPRQMALRGWLESWNGHLQKYIKVKTGSHLTYDNILIIKGFFYAQSLMQIIYLYKCYYGTTM